MPITTDAELYSASNWYPSPPILLPSEGLDDPSDFQTVSWIYGSLLLTTGIPQLPPLIIFLAPARHTAITATLDVLTWVASARHTSITSIARSVTYVAPARHTAIASTLDVFTWVASARLTAIMSVARGGG